MIMSFINFFFILFLKNKKKIFLRVADDNPASLLQIFHHFFIEYSKDVYKYFVDKNYELYSKNDLRFMETIYKILVKLLDFEYFCNESLYNE